MTNARMLKELQSLAPWTWDKKCEKHPPGQKALHDFERVEHYSSWPKPPPSASKKTSRAINRDNQAETTRPEKKPKSEQPTPLQKPPKEAHQQTPRTPALPPPETPAPVIAATATPEPPTTDTKATAPFSASFRPSAASSSFYLPGPSPAAPPAMTPGISMSTPRSAAAATPAQREAVMPRRLSLSEIASKKDSKSATPQQKTFQGQPPRPQKAAAQKPDPQARLTSAQKLQPLIPAPEKQGGQNAQPHSATASESTSISRASSSAPKAASATVSAKPANTPKSCSAVPPANKALPAAKDPNSSLTSTQGTATGAAPVRIEGSKKIITVVPRSGVASSAAASPAAFTTGTNGSVKKTSDRKRIITLRPPLTAEQKATAADPQAPRLRHSIPPLFVTQSALQSRHQQKPVTTGSSGSVAVVPASSNPKPAVEMPSAPPRQDPSKAVSSGHRGPACQQNLQNASKATKPAHVVQKESLNTSASASGNSQTPAVLGDITNVPANKRVNSWPLFVGNHHHQESKSRLLHVKNSSTAIEDLPSDDDSSFSSDDDNETMVPSVAAASLPPLFQPSPLMQCDRPQMMNRAFVALRMLDAREGWKY